MKQFPLRTLFAASLAMVLSQSAFAEEKAKPELITGANAAMLSNACAGCHGPNGVSSGPSIPTIAGMSGTYLVEIMEGYKSGDVPSTIMGRIAKGYSSEEFAQMGEFFAKQKYVEAEGQKSDAGKAKLGAEIHEKYCDKCHTEGGTLAEDEAGFLKGQWKSYTAAQLMDFVSGYRKPPKKMKKALKKVKKKHGPAGIEALIEYYSSK